MVPQERAARPLTIDDMEAAGGVRGLALLVQDAAALRNSVDVDPGGGRRDDAAVGQRRNRGPGVVLPRPALVVAVRIAQIVVRDHIRGLPPRPGGLDPAIQVVEAVDVGVIVAALEVFPDPGPGMGRRAVQVEVAVARARPVQYQKSNLA